MLTALPPDHRAVLDTLLEARSFPRGAVLMPQGAPGDGCCFIQSGTVRVELSRASG